MMCTDAKYFPVTTTNGILMWPTVTRNPGLGLGQEQTCGDDKLVNGINTYKRHAPLYQQGF
jgi:hypothetical protein